MPDVYINPEDTPKVSKKTKVGSFDINPVNKENLKGHTHNPLSSYCYFPHNVGFSTKEPDEKIILVVRRHVLTNIGWIVLVVLMIAAPLALKTFPLLNFLPMKFQMVSILFWYLLATAIAIQGFLGWFFSVNIITNMRVIDIDFENLIYRKITDAKIENIEDATVRMGSVVRTLFDFGDVMIQTAAEMPEITFWAVPHPDRI